VVESLFAIALESGHQVRVAFHVVTRVELAAGNTTLANPVVQPVGQEPALVTQECLLKIRILCGRDSGELVIHTGEAVKYDPKRTGVVKLDVKEPRCSARIV
jgi:hypothetical protein